MSHSTDEEASHPFSDGKATQLSRGSNPAWPASRLLPTHRIPRGLWNQVSGQYLSSHPNIHHVESLLHLWHRGK